MPARGVNACVLAKGLALPEDEIVMGLGGSSYEIRHGRVGDALKRTALRSPMRLIKAKRIHGRLGDYFDFLPW
jgi:hypothetical protein